MKYFRAVSTTNEKQQDYQGTNSMVSVGGQVEKPDEPAMHNNYI